MIFTKPSIRRACWSKCAPVQHPAHRAGRHLVFLLPVQERLLPQLFVPPTRRWQDHHFHSAITPVIVSPGHRQVVPLRPEFITPQDGQVKQDCEINAAKRWLAAHAARYATGNDTLLGDDLYAHQPFCRQVLLHGFHFLFTCKPASHATLHQWVEGLEPGRQLHTLKLRVKGKSNRWEHHLYRWANGVPLTDSDDASKSTGAN
jgi:hypothetical protein